VRNGLLVLGAGLGADVAGAADRVALELRRSGEQPATVTAVASAGRASPRTAAAHEGTAIDPGALVSRIREAAGDGTAVIAAAGGVLAPLTARYSVRDLARELGLPAVLVVATEPDLVNVARLSLESLRAAGIAVAAVALTGWPDPPSRVQLDERGLLEQLAGVPLVTLPGERGWTAARWIDAAAPAGTRAPAPAPVPERPARAPLVLDPYRAWEPQPQGDPRSTPRPRIMDALLAIVAAEGPMRAGRAYAVYNRAAGGRKLTTIARAPLSSAAYWLAREGRLLLTRAEDIPWQDDDLLRTPETPAVHVRELGPRTLEEVPLDEVAELMRRLQGAGAHGDDALKRGVLDAYRLVRLTQRADEYLGLAIGLLAR
jgi:dethiobiotin synthetase